ncbi:hypothetical protein [Chitiniphilus shinanonensis]|nr:hypothetical protein [Chitiniphilus shinanonensis]
MDETHGFQIDLAPACSIEVKNGKRPYATLTNTISVRNDGATDEQIESEGAPHFIATLTTQINVVLPESKSEDDLCERLKDPQIRVDIVSSGMPLTLRQLRLLMEGAGLSTKGIPLNMVPEDVELVIDGTPSK